MFISDYITTQITQLKTALQEIWIQKTNGAMMHSKATWYDVGGKPMKYFLNLEKCHYSQKTINKLILKDGHIVTNYSDILQALTEYYQCLFTSDPNVTGKLNLDSNQLPKICDEYKEVLDKPYTIDEIEMAMKATVKGKVPSIGGYGIELLQAHSGMNSLAHCFKPSITH